MVIKYLSLDEQQCFHRALRRSVKIIHEPKENDMVVKVGDLFIPTAEEVSPYAGETLAETLAETLKQKYEPFPVDHYNPNLRIGDKVKMFALGDDRLEGRTGTLVGIVSSHVLIHWIIELDEPAFFPYGIPLKCVQMPSVCLERIKG